MYGLRHVSYFSRSPFNYETLTKRISQKYKDRNVPVSLLRDCVESCRKLQLVNRNVENADLYQFKKLLNIKTGTSGEIESQLADFLVHFKRNMDESVIRSYLLIKPMPSNNMAILDIMRAYNNVKNGRIDYKVVFMGLRLMLENKDFYNCFKLIDETFNNEAYVRIQTEKLNGQFFFCGMIVIGLFVGIIFIPDDNWKILSIVMFGQIMTLASVFVAMSAFNNNYRLAWRKGTSQFHKIIHHNEYKMVSKIFNSFEENFEVNVKNYHWLNNGPLKDLRIVRFHDFILEGAEDMETNVIPYDESVEVHNIRLFLLSELRRRRLRLVPNRDELLFREYWAKSGDEFEWVEPDQDPAEIVERDVHERTAEDVRKLPL